MKFPFEVALEEIRDSPDKFISAVFSLLESEFLVLPKGEGFVEYAVFEKGYESLKRATEDFSNVTVERVLPLASRLPITVIVIRTILGFTPPEWAYVASQRSGVVISQGFARALDRGIRMDPEKPLGKGEALQARVKVLVTAACEFLSEGAPAVPGSKIHRLDKADTARGLSGVQSMADIGVPYAMLLYERLLGRPFAGHRDSVSELMGDNLESAIEDVLSSAGISYRKTKRAERVVDFDQAPDFIVPSEFNPQVVIEAKMTEDDGTARDKVTRVQHLAELARAGQPIGFTRYQVIACIGGRGFGVRREDMRKLLYATGGKVFTPNTLHRLIDCTRLHEFQSKH